MALIEQKMGKQIVTVYYCNSRDQFVKTMSEEKKKKK